MDRNELGARLIIFIVGSIVTGLGTGGLSKIVGLVLSGLSHGDVYGIVAGGILFYFLGGILMLITLIGLIIVGFGILGDI